MKISTHWLNEYLDRPVDAATAQAVLLAQGFPIEQQIETPDQGLTLDVEVTSNRGDCLSHVGVAREVAAGTGGKLVTPTCELPDHDGQAIERLTSVDNLAPQFCPLYTARVIRGVKVGKSPDWLVKRLEAIGLRSVNNVVDVTNFVLHELGQPLHAFDLDKLEEQRIVVRLAKDKENFTAIDGSKHVLSNQMLVIADANKPVAVAGVMGGLDSEVGDTTTNILIESAVFAPLSVRRTSRALKLASDSSYRFERGIDLQGVDRASRRAAAMIIELAGGKLSQGVIQTAEVAPEAKTIVLAAARCQSLLGVALSLDDMADKLAALGIDCRCDPKSQTLTATVPSHRLDLERDVDLIEEIARMYGLDRIPTQPRISIEARPPQPVVQARQRLGQVMSAHGFFETITFSFIAEKLGQPFLEPDTQAVTISDERRKAEPMLRPSLLPSLLQCRKANQDLGNTGVRLYEVASVWHQRGKQIIESTQLALLADMDQGETSLRHLRGTLDRLLTVMGFELPTLRIQPREAVGFDQAMGLDCDGQPLGVFGVIDPAVVDLFGLQTPVIAAVLDVAGLLKRYPPVRTVGALPRFPGIERDLSLVLDESVTWERIAAVVDQTRPALLESLAYLVTYRGKPIAKGQKSVSLRMVFRDPARTLRHDEVDPQVNAVVAAMKTKLSATLRT